jgi:putative DNA primase/helicase
LSGPLKTLIELRGEGAYVLAPPSPGACHQTGRPYVLDDGSPDLTSVPLITAEERQVLLDAAALFDESTPIAGPIAGPRLPRKSGPLLPGEDFDQRGQWDEILSPCGWEDVGGNPPVRYWRRPGKESGHSATTGYCSGQDGTDLLHVFSSNADPFEQDHSYGKFAALALLYFNGDFAAAAAYLRTLGYGDSSSAPV